MPATQSLPFEHEIAEAFLVNSAALEKAAEDFQKSAAVKAACAKLIPVLGELAVKTAAIEANERHDFEAALADPEKALQLFKFALEQRNANATAIQATEVDASGRKSGNTKRASARSANPFVGGGAGREMANAAFDETMGIH